MDAITNPDNTTIAPNTGQPKQPSLLTAAQIEKNCPAKLHDLGKRISVHLEKAAQCDERANNHRITAGQLLAQAKEACDDGGFTAFRERFCPNLGKSRAYELLAIATGKKSDEEIRAENAERNRRHRAKKKAEPAVRHVTESLAANPAPAAPTDDAPAASTPPAPTQSTSAPSVPAPSPLALTPEAAPVVADEPTVEEAEAEVKRLKALRAKINANCEDDSKIDPEASAKALAEFKFACEAWLPKMNADDLQNATDHFAEVVEVPATELTPSLREAQLDVKIAKVEVTALKRKLAGKLPPNESRAAAWSRLANEAASNIEDLIAYQGEFEELREGQPDSLQDGPFAQKCEAVCDIDLATALELMQEAENADLPLGFGRD